MTDSQAPLDVMRHDGSTDRDEPPDPFGSGVMTFLSTLNVATLLSLLIGICIFYDHSYREAYLGSFKLDPKAVPASVQDSVVAGFLGLNQHVLWLLVILTVLTAGYVATIWVGTHWLAKVAPRLGINDRGSPPATLVALGRSNGFRASILAAAIALALTVTSGIALLLVGLPAEKAGRSDARQLHADVRSGKPECIWYRLKDQEIVALKIDGATDQQYVLGTDDALHVVKLSELVALYQTPVPCAVPRTSE